jgi:hypothetical protein
MAIESVNPATGERLRTFEPEGSAYLFSGCPAPLKGLDIFSDSRKYILNQKGK